MNMVHLSVRHPLPYFIRPNCIHFLRIKGQCGVIRYRMHIFPEKGKKHSTYTRGSILEFVVKFFKVLELAHILLSQLLKKAKVFVAAFQSKKPALWQPGPSSPKSTASQPRTTSGTPTECAQAQEAPPPRESLTDSLSPPNSKKKPVSCFE